MKRLLIGLIVFVSFGAYAIEIKNVLPSAV